MAFKRRHIQQYIFLSLGESNIVSTQVANRFVKHWNATLPITIGQSVLCRPSDQYRGSMTITMLGKNKYQITHHNDTLNREYARKDVPYEG